MLFGKPNANPNATAAKNAIPGTVPGSTPPILLAATRGYYKVSDRWVPYVLFCFIRFKYMGHNLLLTTTIIAKTKISIPSENVVTSSTLISLPYLYNKQVVDVFKRHPSTNFLISNKFNQTILHIVLKAGYYNKIGKL